MSTLAVEGLEFYAHHGVYPAEQQLGTRFVVDVYLELELAAAAANDQVEDTSDYTRVYSVVKAEMGERRNLLETLAYRTAERLLLELPTVNSVRVRVSKYHPPIQGLCARTYVEHNAQR